jgi:hypothetical protein
MKDFGSCAALPSMKRILLSLAFILTPPFPSTFSHITTLSHNAPQLPMILIKSPDRTFITDPFLFIPFELSDSFGLSYL